MHQHRVNVLIYCLHLCRLPSCTTDDAPNYQRRTHREREAKSRQVNDVAPCAPTIHISYRRARGWADSLTFSACISAAAPHQPIPLVKAHYDCIHCLSSRCPEQLDTPKQAGWDLSCGGPLTAALCASCVTESQPCSGETVTVRPHKTRPPLDVENRMRIGRATGVWAWMNTADSSDSVERVQNGPSPVLTLLFVQK